MKQDEFRHHEARSTWQHRWVMYDSILVRAYNKTPGKMVPGQYNVKLWLACFEQLRQFQKCNFFVAVTEIAKV